MIGTALVGNRDQTLRAAVPRINQSGRRRHRGRVHVHSPFGTSPANTTVYFFNISTYCFRNLATFGAITILQYGCIGFCAKYFW
jgi:hypothetical protein